MPSLADVPLEVLIDNLLPHLPLPSIAALALTSRDFAALCADDTFWKRKLQEDYNFSDASTARTSGGYRFLYRGFYRARIYVWGSSGEGRLGMNTQTIARGRLLGRGHIPYPTRLDVPGPRIVELAAGGWSFHALDADGGVHAWGQLDGEGFGLHVDSFALPTKRSLTPLKLALPEKITHLSCGRRHAAALSAANRVWVFTAWGTPYVMTSTAFAEPLRQIECGWGFIAVLTQAGDVFVWWPLEGEFGRLGEQNQQMVMESEDNPIEIDDVVQCRPWNVDVHPDQMPGIASELPRLRDPEISQDKIVKIAGGDNFLIALTEGGHVLRTDFEHEHESFRSIQGRPRWKYLPRFSEMSQIRSLPEFSSENNNGLVVPENMHITHISAHFESFFAYTTGPHSIVLQGKRDPLPLESVETTPPTVTPGLQNKGVISVVLGDYHYGALTADGRFFTWGGYSSGALGLGDPVVLPVGAPGGYATQEQQANAQRFLTPPPDVLEPAEVKFGTRGGGEGRKVFVFTTTASGWHTGALVIDLEEDDDKDGERENGRQNPEPEPSYSFRPLPGRLPFRVGLAGAWGRGRGGGSGA